MKYSMIETDLSRLEKLYDSFENPWDYTPKTDHFIFISATLSISLLANHLHSTPLWQWSTESWILLAGHFGLGLIFWLGGLLVLRAITLYALPIILGVVGLIFDRLPYGNPLVNLLWWILKSFLVVCFCQLLAQITGWYLHFH